MPRELWFEAPRVVALREGAPPGEPGPGEIVARALASGVSQGTELLLYRGEGPTPFDPSLDSFAAVATYPRRYGYAWVGEVVACGSGSSRARGDRVFALAPHGEVHRLADDAARPLPRAIPAARAALGASLETAITCVWDGEIALGDEVVVLGGGTVGLLIAMLATKAGGHVRVIEPSERRRDAARALGVDAALHPDEDRPDASADVVIEATGDPALLDRAIAHAAREARVVVASFYGARTAPVALGDAFHRRRLRLVASQVSSIPASRAPRWDPARRFALVRSLLLDARLDALVDAIPFADAPAAYARLDADPAAALQTVLVYES